MARIIAICNAKGGVGKTTTSTNLCAYLAAAGKYVLLVDMDAQANATTGLGVHVAENGSNVYHSLISDLNPNLAIKKTSLFGFDILPSAQSLAGATV
ncbi:MAG: AAA family ATPase, partial [bacterium]|nr:AAA family ATPase [bacterium]